MINAMKMALEALENGGLLRQKQAITALRQAIEQAEKQKPVAWLEPEWGEKICPEVGYETTMTDDHPRDLCWIPLYAAPTKREWVGLTDEEIKDMLDCRRGGLIDIKKAEQILREKNNA